MPAMASTSSFVGGVTNWAPAIEPRALFEDELVLVAPPSLIERLPLEDLTALSRHTLLTAKARREDWHNWALHFAQRQSATQVTRQFDHMHRVCPGQTSRRLSDQGHDDALNLRC